VGTETGRRRRTLNRNTHTHTPTHTSPFFSWGGKGSLRLMQSTFTHSSKTSHQGLPALPALPALPLHTTNSHNSPPARVRQDSTTNLLQYFLSLLQNFPPQLPDTRLLLPQWPLRPCTIHNLSIAPMDSLRSSGLVQGCGAGKYPQGIVSTLHLTPCLFLAQSRRKV
jgi:hypothetical protein